MLLSHDGVKAGVRVVRFLEDAWGRPSTPKEAKAVVTAVAKDLCEGKRWARRLGGT